MFVITIFLAFTPFGIAILIGTKRHTPFFVKVSEFFGGVKYHEIVLATTLLCGTLLVWIASAFWFLIQWTNISALGQHGLKMFLAFCLSGAMMLSLFSVPLFTIVEIGWITYFVLRPGTLFDIKERGTKGMPYIRIIPHLLALAFVGLTYLCRGILHLEEIFSGFFYGV